jgi:hypothetical protein
MGERNGAKETARPVSPALRLELILARYSDAKAPSNTLLPLSYLATLPHTVSGGIPGAHQENSQPRHLSISQRLRLR